MLKRKIGKMAGQILLVVGIIGSVGIAYLVNQRGGIKFMLLGTEFEIDHIHYLAALLAGAVVGWALGQMVNNLIRGRRWRRWVAMVTLIVFVLTMTVLFGRNVFIVALISVFLTILFTIAIQRELYGGGIKTTAAHHFRLSTGSMRGFQVIDNGKTIFPKNAGQLLGPLMLVIRSGNAVVTVDGSSLNVYGPGVGNMIEFEYVKEIYQLGEHRRSFEIKNVFTAERIPINAKVSINFAIDIPYDRAFGENDPTGDDKKAKKKLKEVDKKAILTLYQCVKDWKAATLDIVEQVLRDIVNSMDFATFNRPKNQERLAQEIKNRANKLLWAKEWPIVVHQMVIKDIQPEQKIAETMSKAWAQKREAEARATVLVKMARAYEIASKRGMTERERRDLVLKTVVEYLASDPTTSIMFNQELNELMAMLRK